MLMKGLHKSSEDIDHGKCVELTLRKMMILERHYGSISLKQSHSAENSRSFPNQLRLGSQTLVRK